MYGLGPGGTLLGGRYRIVRELGRGGFGHTYLSEDNNRFQELCVLKEFVPQVQGEAALEKALQLFSREASILYQLDHPQIPRFRELFREGGRLFLVQDYVEGPTYQDLLQTRRRYAGQFSEAEVTALLRQLLPVLQYLHSLGIIHRDIAPDNLIQRNADGLPVLIDFGGVKQLVVNVRHQLGVAAPYANAAGQVTRLGKVGYAPPEQLDSGVAGPDADLYALGVTALVLLSGKDPEQLYDAPTKTWRWQSSFTVSPALAVVLDRLVASLPSDRYAAAAAVMADLSMAAPYGSPPPLPPRMQPLTPPPPAPPLPPPSPAPLAPTGPAYIAINQPPYTLPTPTYTPPALAQPDPLPPVRRKKVRRASSGCGQALLGLLVLLSLASLAWWGLVTYGGQWLQTNPISGWLSGSGSGSSRNPNFAPDEQARKQAISDRSQALGVDKAYLTRLSDQLFYEGHRDLQGRKLTDSAEDAALRAEWDAIAAEMLTLLEQNLSKEARSRLGQYTSADLGRWKTQVNDLYVSSRALYDLADARYGQLFPGRVNDGFVDQPTNQIWYALAQDRVNALASGEKLSEIKFEKGVYSQQVQATLNPGEGQVYILSLTSGQLMRLNLQANPAETLISLYLPSPTDKQPYLLADAKDTLWSGELSQTGYYEIVVVSTAQQPLSYQLNVAVDTVVETSPEDLAKPNDKD